MSWTVEVEFRASRVHGAGVFARKDIAAGTRIWEVDAGMRFFEREALEALPPATLARALHGGYLHWPANRFVWYDDGMQFMNHASGPAANIGLDHWPQLMSDHTVALRDIAAGEELLEDYGFWAETGASQGHWMEPLYRAACPEHLAFLRSLAPEPVRDLAIVA